MQWQDVSGWLLQCEGAALQCVCAGKIVLEIGPWQGRSTICIAEVAKHVTTIEHFQADDSIRRYYPQPRSPNELRKDLARNIFDFWNIDVIDSPWEPIISDTIADLHPDVIFYDASHEAIAIEHFLQKVVDYPGVLCIHDYAKPEWRLSTTLIDGFIQSRGDSFCVIGSLITITPQHVTD